MISFSLYRLGLRANYKVLVIFLLVLSMYISVSTSMFDPKLGKTLEELAKSMPQIMAMAGMSNVSSTLTGFMVDYLYGFLLLVFPMVFTIIISNRLVARHVDRGSMAYLLASPNSRAKVAFTQMKVLGTLLLVLILYCTLFGIAVGEALFPGELDIGAFILLNAGLLILHLFIGGICFFGSCVSNETRHSLSIGAGVPAVFYLIRMLANMGGKLENLKYATFFTLFDPRGLIDYEAGAFLMSAVLLVAGAALFAAAIALFCKRDLPL